MRVEGSAGWEKEYDADGRVIRRMYLGTDEKPLLQADGYAGVSIRYDDAGNIIQYIYLGENGRPLLQPEGYAGSISEYDEQGREVAKEYLDENLETIQYLIKEYDEDGECTTYYFDGEGNFLRKK